SSSLRKNLEVQPLLSFLRVGCGCAFGFSVAALVLRTPAWLRREQFRDADQIVGDQVEQEVGSDAGDAAMFGLAHRPVLLAPAEDAFDHGPARLRHAIAFMPRGAGVDGAAAAVTG